MQVLFNVIAPRSTENLKPPHCDKMVVLKGSSMPALPIPKYDPLLFYIYSQKAMGHLSGGPGH